MQPDRGQAALDRRIAATSVEERVAWVAAKRDLGFRLVWQQVDAAGISDPLGQARFLLRRLYPELPEAWFEATVSKLEERHAQGRWHGLQRP